MRPGYSLPVLALLLGSCAQVAELSGGEKDTIPPRLLAARPDQYTTRFSGDRIVLDLNERITLDRVRDRMLISPPLDVEPTVRLSGPRSITIDLKSALKANTTYTFGIGEAVKDLTEGNFASDLRYVISTGEVLDSLWFAGVVVDAFSNAPVPDVLVLLYEAEDTATIRTSRPAYAGRSKADGSFKIEHLRAGRYRSYALRDQNSNYLFDLPNEEVAFIAGTVTPGASDSASIVHQLRLFQEKSPVLSIREVRVIPDGALRFVLSRAGERVALRDVARTGGGLSWYPAWNAGMDTVLLWPSDTTELRQGRYEVRINGEVLDTVRYRPVDRMPFHTGLDATVNDDGAAATVILRSARPLAVYDKDRLSIMVDSVAIPFTAERDTLDPTRIHLRADLPAGSAGKLVVLPRMVRDIYGGYNDTLSIGVGRAAENSTGSLEVRVPQGSVQGVPLIVRLLDAQGRTARTTYLENGHGTITWERIRPGAYRILAIKDLEPNGEWDTGDLDNGTQPEEVIRLPGAINIRAAWDLVVDLPLKDGDGPIDGPAPLDQ